MFTRRRGSSRLLTISEQHLEGAAKLVDLDGEARDREDLARLLAVFLDERAELEALEEGSAADATVLGDGREM